MTCQHHCPRILTLHAAADEADISLTMLLQQPGLHLLLDELLVTLQTTRHRSQVHQHQGHLEDDEDDRLSSNPLLLIATTTSYMSL